MQLHPACFRERIPLKTQLSRYSVHWPLLFISFLILLVTGDIAARLLSTAFPPGLIGTSLLLSCSAILVLFNQSNKNTSLLRTLLTSVLLGVVLIAATSSIPGNESIQFLSIAIALGIGSGIFMLTHRSEQRITVENTTTKSLNPQAEAIALDLQRVAPVLPSDQNHMISDQEETESSQEEVLQSWRRLKLQNGTERLEGSLVLQFAAGEKIQHSHLPIAPALKSLPQAWCECSDSSIRVEFNVLQTYGVRLTARRGSGPLIEESVEVNFTVESCPNKQAVA